MQEFLKEVNKLPAPTWQHLGVNKASFPLLQTVRNCGKNIAKPACCFCPAKQGAAESSRELPEEFAAVKTGMGDEAAAYAAEHCTAFTSIQLQEGEQVAMYNLPYAFKSGCAQGDVTLIHARSGSSITVLQSYISGDETACQHTGLTKIIADAGAKVRLLQVQLLSKGSHHFSDIGITLGDEASVEVVQAELGGLNAYTGCLAALAGRKSNFSADTIYFGDGNRKLDFNYIARHTGKKTTSTMKAAGALFGKSDKIYRGTIDFIRGASRSVGHESEETLLFSGAARNRTVPLILCDEEDVEGQHAATIGKINKARMFYLQSRGLSEAQIKQLAVEAMFNPLLAKLPDEKLRQEVKIYLGRSIAID